MIDCHRFWDITLWSSCRYEMYERIWYCGNFVIISQDRSREGNCRYESRFSAEVWQIWRHYKLRCIVEKISTDLSEVGGERGLGWFIGKRLRYRISVWNKISWIVKEMLSSCWAWTESRPEGGGNMMYRVDNQYDNKSSPDISCDKKSDSRK